MENFKIVQENKNKIIKLIEQVKSFIALKSTIVDDPDALKKMNELIDFHKKMVPSKMQHPIDKAYSGEINGGLFNEYTKKWSNKKSRLGGYIDDKICTDKKIKCKKRHRLIYECFYQETIADGFQIDHIDSNSSNNSIFNLQKLTTKEHGKKTHGGKKGNGKLKRSKSVTRFKINEDEEEVDLVVYDSIADAAIAIRCKSSDIANVLRGSQKTTRGYFFKYTEIKEDEKFKNEEWKKLADIDDRFKDFKSEISDFGRVRSERGIISCGTKHHSGYSTVGIKGTKYLIHILVTLAFHGIRPSNKHSVDHINRKKNDNRKENLRWATASEQQDNYSTKPINVYKNGKLVGNYKSFALAAKNIKVSNSYISLCVKKKMKTSEGYTFELAKDE